KAAVTDTLAALFARRRPAPSTVFIDVPDGQTVTYGDADRESARLAGALGQLGVRPGDRVAVQVEKSPAMILLYLACVRAGAVLLPMNPAYTDDEVAYLVDDAEPTVVVQEPERAGPSGLTSLALAELAAAQPPSYDDVARGPDDLAAILYTSGTTGKPKGAMLTQRNLASNAAALHAVWGFGPDDVLLHALPIFHTHGLFVATNCVLANGTGMVFLPRFDTTAVIEHLRRCTVFMGVPTFYTRLLADPSFDAGCCRSIRVFISGSAPLLASTHAEFRARTGHAILERYGMTETSMITSNPLDGERRAGTVGFALPGVDVRVDGDGGIGGIEVRGPNVFAGYWRRPELTASEFTDDGFFCTGDVGALDADAYLSIVGRSKDLIISGGLNVYPKEIEEVLDDLPGVVESAVVGLPDPDFGEAVVAVVIAEPGAALDGEALRDEVRRRLAAFKVPKRVVVAEALPRNAMGKVEKAKLRASLVGG
ncbi:MAG TPA: AMP-binding protein, partial [Acidimicrobiales bacterium]